MAQRPVFVPNTAGYPFVREVPIEFTWFPGMAISQAQKSITSLHEAAEKRGFNRLLEISSKSKDPLGIALSAFNLMLNANRTTMSVECAFQGSKIFENGGPYRDLYRVTSREAKKDERIRNSGSIIEFNFMGKIFPTIPITLFYDWLYISALRQNPKLAVHLSEFDGFTDIAFNPQKSWNCQARAAAMYVALNQSGKLDDAVSDIGYYLSLPSDSKRPTSGVQMGFGFG